jgi:dihydroflavonol-4-reductase
MKIFITGATGFIGGHLVRRLARGGHQMQCLARRTSRTDVLRDIGAKAVFGDVTDKESVLAGMSGCDAVVNLANLFEFWVRDPRVYSDVNILGTRNVMESAITSRVTKVIHVSTVAIYGSAAWPITEASEVGARCPSKYAQTKRVGDFAAWELYQKGNLPLLMVYPGGVLGPDDHKAVGRYVSNLVRGKMPAQVLTRSVFPWVHVRDVAEAIARALEKPGNIGEKYIVVAENHTFGDINRMVCDLSGVKLPSLTLPDPVTIALARVMTGLADLTRKPPVLDLAIDQIRLMKQGFRADGSKAAKDLGFSYTPIRLAVEEEVRTITGAGLHSVSA